MPLISLEECKIGIVYDWKSVGLEALILEIELKIDLCSVEVLQLWEGLGDFLVFIRSIKSKFLKINLHKYVNFGFLLYRGLIVLIMKHSVPECGFEGLK